MPLPAPPPSVQQTKLTATEYFKSPVNPDEYDGKVENIDTMNKLKQTL